MRIRKRTAHERKTLRDQNTKFLTIFINGKKKRVPRPQQIEGLDIDEFIARNADPIFLHQNEMWEYLAFDKDCGGGLATEWSMPEEDHS